MAHFAELNIFKKVLRVLTLENKDTQDKNGNEVESIGAKYLYDSFGGTWVKTSYNTLSGVHKLGGTPFRKNYAGTEYTYDDTRDAFIPPKPFPSWTLNEDTCQWDPPTPYPDDGQEYEWNEAEQRWDEV
tara:strand:+ start:180 stop:566 length:387 start_codon:yes stop_codon:yes gene_type:complete